MATIIKADGFVESEAYANDAGLKDVVYWRNNND